MLPARASARAPKEVDYGISSDEDSEGEFAPVKAVVEETGDKIEKVLDVRDGPVGFTGNQTILYNDNLQETGHTYNNRKQLAYSSPTLEGTKSNFFQTLEGSNYYFG